MQLHLSALGHQKEGQYDEARTAYEELLQMDFIRTASPVSVTLWLFTKGTYPSLPPLPPTAPPRVSLIRLPSASSTPL